MAERVSLIEPEAAEGLTKLMFDAAHVLSGGRVPNSLKAGAHVPFIQMMFMPFVAVASREGGGGTLSTKIKEMAVIKTSQLNGCAY